MLSPTARLRQFEREYQRTAWRWPGPSMVSPAPDQLTSLLEALTRALEDAVGVIRRQDGRLDWDYVSRWVADFAELPGREGLGELLNRVRQDAS